MTATAILRGGVPPVPMISAVEAYVAGFALRENAMEIPYASNAGVLVNMAQRVTHNHAGDPWCASECHLVGVTVFGDRWPLPRTGSTNEMGQWALAHGIIRYTPSLYELLIQHGALDARAHPRERYVQPFQRGDIFGLYSPRKRRYHHVGLITDVETELLRTREGNTVPPAAQRTATEEQSRDGQGNYPSSKLLSLPLCAMRWVDLLHD